MTTPERYGQSQESTEMLRHFFTSIFGMLALWSGGAICSALAKPSSQVDVLIGASARTLHREFLARVDYGFGGALIIEKDGKIALKAGYGFANRARKRAFTTTTDRNCKRTFSRIGVIRALANIGIVCLCMVLSPSVTTLRALATACIHRFLFLNSYYTALPAAYP